VALGKKIKKTGNANHCRNQYNQFTGLLKITLQIGQMKIFEGANKKVDMTLSGYSTQYDRLSKQ